jgi:hypothetical protein
MRSAFDAFGAADFGHSVLNSVITLVQVSLSVSGIVEPQISSAPVIKVVPEAVYFLGVCCVTFILYPNIDFPQELAWSHFLVWAAVPT